MSSWVLSVASHRLQCQVVIVYVLVPHRTLLRDEEGGLGRHGIFGHGLWIGTIWLGNGVSWLGFLLVFYCFLFSLGQVMVGFGR